MKKVYFLVCVLTILSCKKEIQQQFVNQKNIPLDEYNELIALSDTTSLKTYEEFNYRITRIQEIFSLYNDKRGTFPTIYKAITHAAVVSIANQDYHDNAYTQRFSIEFSKRYLSFLKHHLLNEPLEYHWNLYYQHALAGYHNTRLVLEGINAHVTIDMVRSLAATGVYSNYKTDWILFGDKTVASVPLFLDELKQEYNTNASEVFKVFFVGDIIDPIFGQGATINFGFNVLRLDAFDNALILKNNPSNSSQVEKNIQKSFQERENLFDAIDKLNLTP